MGRSEGLYFRIYDRGCASWSSQKEGFRDIPTLKPPYGWMRSWLNPTLQVYDTKSRPQKAGPAFGVGGRLGTEPPSASTRKYYSISWRSVWAAFVGRARWDPTSLPPCSCIHCGFSGRIWSGELNGHLDGRGVELAIDTS